MEPGWVTQPVWESALKCRGSHLCTSKPLLPKTNCHQTKSSCPKHVCLLFYTILLKALIVLNGRVQLLYVQLRLMGQRLPESSHLPVLNIAIAFGGLPGLQELLKIISVSSDDSLDLYSKDFALIKSFLSHDRRGKGLHQSCSLVSLLFFIFFPEHKLEAFMAVMSS